MIAAALVFNGSLMAETTLGEPSYAQWLKRSAKSESDRAWLLGLMSGLNLADSKEEDHLSKIAGPQEIFQWVTVCCRANQQKKISEAGIELYVELLRLTGHHLFTSHQ
jgi:hypothetical protein